jgi:hypothetical protein
MQQVFAELGAKFHTPIIVKVASSSPSDTVFLYGTLMHPEVLKKVIGNQGLHLQIAPAVLLSVNSVEYCHGVEAN